MSAVAPAGSTTHLGAADAWTLPGLRVDRAARRADLLVGPDLLNPGGTLWGGCGLAVAIAAAEGVLDRTVLWATVQYVTPIAAGEHLDLTVATGGAGRRMSQVEVRGTVDGRLALLALGTFGTGAGPGTGVGATGAGATGAGVTGAGVTGSGPGSMAAGGPARMALPAPAQCPPCERPSGDRGMSAHFDQRWAIPASGAVGAGAVAGRRLWLRARSTAVPTAALLAVMADFAPAALAGVYDTPMMIVSLDNSLRLAAPAGAAASGWVLVDAQADSLTEGVAHLTARLLSEDGRLLATAGQSALVRPFVR